MTSFEPERHPNQPLPPEDRVDIREQFESLVNAHHQELVIYACALTSDWTTARDLVQEAFVLAYDKAAVFDVTKDFGAWMRGIVRNKWREWRRANRRYDLSDNLVALIDHDIASWQAEREKGRSPLLLSLENCLTQLPQNLADAVRVSYFEGCSSEEAAVRLGVSPAATRKRLQRARDLLKTCLDQKLATHQKNEV